MVVKTKVATEAPAAVAEVATAPKAAAASTAPAAAAAAAEAATEAAAASVHLAGEGDPATRGPSVFVRFRFRLFPFCFGFLSN